MIKDFLLTCWREFGHVCKITGIIMGGIVGALLPFFFVAWLMDERLIPMWMGWSMVMIWFILLCGIGKKLEKFG